jgi:serine/threonine-protein kinase
MAYLSADRIAGRPATVGDDLYAVGVVGYEALAGRRPFPQENLAELACAVAMDTPPPLAVVRPDVDTALAATIERALAHDPAWRFASADEMRAALAGRVGPPVRQATRVMAAPLPDATTVVVPPPVRRSRSSRWLWGVAAVLFALVVSIIAIVVDSTSRPAVPEPAGTSTSVAPPPTPAFAPPPPASTPVQVEHPKPKKPGETGNGNGRKKGGDDG